MQLSILRFILGLLICVSIIFFTACQTPLNIEGSAVATLPMEVKLTYDIEPAANGKVKIVGETNLPDETNLNLRIMGLSVKYDVSFDTKVQAGQFHSQEFSADSKALPTGDYKAATAMALTTLQPPNVRAIIGKNGEYIAGSLVRRYENSAAVIEVRKKFHLQPDGSVIVAIDPKIQQP